MAPFAAELPFPIIHQPIQAAVSLVAQVVTLAVVEQSYMAHADRILGRTALKSEVNDRPAQIAKAQARLQKQAKANMAKMAARMEQQGKKAREKHHGVMELVDAMTADQERKAKRAQATAKMMATKAAKKADQEALERVLVKSAPVSPADWPRGAQVVAALPGLPWVEDDSRMLVAWVDVWPVILPRLCEKSARCLAFDLAGMCSRDKDKMLTPVELVAVLKGVRNMVCQRMLRQINKPMARPLA